MPTLVYNRYTGAKSIPPHIKARTEQRIRDYAGKHCPAKFARIDVRFHGALCYIDVYTEPGFPPGVTPPPGETREQWLGRLRITPMHLCRIRYFGNEDLWRFAWYSYAREKYEPAFLLSGLPHGTPEEAFETSALFC